MFVRSPYRILLVALALLLGAQVASATSYLVRLDGTGDYINIQAAINACGDGDTVLVDDGTYTGVNNRNLDFGGTELVLMSINGPAATIIDCQFLGRGVYFYSNQGSTSVLRGFTIANGSAAQGAGVYIQGGDATGCATLLDNVFVNNHASGQGGAVYVTSTYTPTIHNNWFQSNIATDGGAICTRTALDLKNNVFVGNGVTGNGGAIYATMNGTSVTMRNCDFLGNNAHGEGGALWGSLSAVFNAWDSIFWSNTSPTGPTGYAGPNPGGGVLNFSYCVVNDQSTATVGLTFWGDGMIEDDPLFVGGPDGNYYLAQVISGQVVDSPCVDAGSDRAAAMGIYNIYGDYSNASYLLRMSTRTDGGNDKGTVDIGYHRFTYETLTITVPQDCPGVQYAINRSLDGDLILVDYANYYEIIDFMGKAITVMDAIPGDPKPTLWCDGLGGPGVTFDSGEGPGSVLDGFTVTLASATNGGGIFVYNADPVIRNCDIWANTATNTGGGLACVAGSNPLVEGNIFRVNTSGLEGGGIAVQHSSPTIIDNAFVWNESMAGGAISVYGISTPVISDNSIYYNTANRGGGVYLDECDVTLERCTVTHNEGTLSGGGLYARDGANLTAENSIVSFSSAGAAADTAYGATISLSCSDVYGNTGGDWSGPLTGQLGTGGNFIANPGFCDPASHDFTLYDVSPCLAANNPGCGQVGALGEGCIYVNTTLVVDPSGGGDYLTIQAAVDAAFDGDVVSLVDATYTGDGNRDVDLRGKAITVASASGNPAACVMDCQGMVGDAHRAFVINSGEGSSTIVTGIRITGAYANTGAGIYVSGTSPQIINCHFDTIDGSDGGGIFVGGSGNPIIRQCEFRDISVGNAGAGVCVSYAAATVADCLFEDNYSRWGGTGIYFLDSIGNVSDSIFRNNVCDAWGGGIHVTRAGNFTLTQRCTFDGNSAPYGAHVFARDDGTLDLRTSILTGGGGGGAAAHSRDGGTITTQCTDVWNNPDGDWADGIAGQEANTGNFSADPIYCDAPAGDFSVRDDSPCAADNNPTCGRIGAAGVGCISGMYRTVEWDGSGDYATIQAAIDAAAEGDIVLLGSGTFTGAGNRDLDYHGKGITVRGQDTGAPSIIDSQGSSGDEHRGFYFHTGEGADSILEHVTVTGGYAWDGGGLHATVGVAPTIRDCLFTANHSTDDGGGVFFSHGCGAYLLRCDIQGNWAVNRGGGLYAHDSVATLDSCTVTGNDAATNGGGIYTHENGSVDLQDCFIGDNTSANGAGVYIQGPATSSLLRVRFDQNVATGSGGGFYERDGAVTTFDYCTFYANEADLGGGVYNVFSCTPVFTNCTFTMNSATTRGGAMRIYTGADVTLTNCLLWGDEAGLGDEIAISSSCTLTAYCSNIQDGQDAIDDYDQTSVFDWDDRNLDTFPYFCDANGGDLMLVDGISPCLPAGNSCGVLMGAHGAGCSPPSGVEEETLPMVTRLEPACPNPFNPRTHIHYVLARDSQTRLSVFDSRGRLVRVLVNEVQAAGPRSVVWEGRDERGRTMGAGVYFYRLETMETSLTGKMTLLK